MRRWSGQGFLSGTPAGVRVSSMRNWPATPGFPRSWFPRIYSPRVTCGPRLPLGVVVTTRDGNDAGRSEFNLKDMEPSRIRPAAGPRYLHDDPIAHDSSRSLGRAGRCGQPDAGGDVHRRPWTSTATRIAFRPAQGRGSRGGFRFFSNYEVVKAGHPPKAARRRWPSTGWSSTGQVRQSRLGSSASAPRRPPTSTTSRAAGAAGSVHGHPPQSRPLGDPRSEIDDWTRQVEQRVEGVEPIPRPPHWHGYRIRRVQIELWQGRRSRLHHRHRYVPEGHGRSVTRGAP